MIAILSLIAFVIALVLQLVGADLVLEFALLGAALLAAHFAVPVISRRA